MRSLIPLMLILSTAQAGDLKHVIKNNSSVLGKSICYVGDTGTGKIDQYRVADAMEKDGCDQVRIAGDVIYETGLSKFKNNLFKEKFLNPYGNLIDSGVTFHLVTGNHDYLGNEKLFNKIHKKYDWLYHPNLFYAEINNEVCFINIDSTAVAHIYRIDRQIIQGRWLKKLYKKYKDQCKVALMMGHHPRWSAGKHGEANGWFKRFTKRRISGFVDMYFAGHDHNLSHEGDEKETTFIVTGSGGKLRPLKYKPRGPFAKSVLGYVKVIVSKDNEGYSINYRFKGVDDNDSPYLLYEDTKRALGLR